jgi:hypothetical protein
MNYFFITQRKHVLPPAPFFRQFLRSRWPQAQVEDVLNPTDAHELEFTVPMLHSEVYGSLHRGGEAVVFVGDLRDCAEFALWCQSIIPSGEVATFCDESMSGILEVGAATTVADILQSFA